MRFVKSKYAACVAAKKGFAVSPITKTISWESCRSHDTDVVTTNGFCVEATKAQLEKIGLLSSSCKSQTIVW